MFGREGRPILGNNDAVFVHLQQLNLLTACLGTQDEADRCFLTVLPLVAVEPFQVELHLPLVTGIELTDLQLHGDQPSQQPVLEK